MALSIPSNVAALDPQQLLKNQNPVTRVVGRTTPSLNPGPIGRDDVVELGRSRFGGVADSEATPVAAADGVVQLPQPRSRLARLTDADMADGRAQVVAQQMRSQPQTAYLAQANLSAENVLRLLR